MISVIIPTLNAERQLPETLSALVPAAVAGIVREVIVVDGGSADRTRAVVDHAGADFVESPPCRGAQLAKGGARARFPWLLFLHADTVLEAGWEREACNFMRAVDQGARPRSAAAFGFKLDDKGIAPRALEAIVHVRCSLFKLPYGDQGLLISRQLYSEVGGYKAQPIMEDVDLIRRLGRARVTLFQATATTSAERYKSDGYAVRALRNQACLALYTVGFPAAKIARLYGTAKTAQ